MIQFYTFISFIDSTFAPLKCDNSLKIVVLVKRAIPTNTAVNLLCSHRLYDLLWTSIVVIQEQNMYYIQR